MDGQRVIDIERVSAIDERRLVEVLAGQDPSWGSTTFDLADGVAVLAGPGLFVNQCIAAGLTQSIDPDEIDLFEERAAVVGVAPEFELCDATRPELRDLLQQRGYQPDGGRSVLVHELAGVAAPDPSVAIELVDERSLPHWLTTSAAGWGHETTARRTANDAYGTAAMTADDPGLLLARAADDGRLLGCAALRVTNGIATLGGMSTLPAERGRGVQSALIGWRLRHAAERECRFAVSMAEPGGASERNLRRLGFTPSHTKTAWGR